MFLNGRPLPVPSKGLLAVRLRHHRLYPCLHPAIEPHLPLTLVLKTPEGDQAFRIGEQGTHFETLAGEEKAAAINETREESPPWKGRRHPEDVTIDLRLE
jgi:hypothetical protein